jgi:hypothetical protein
MNFSPQRIKAVGAASRMLHGVAQKRSDECEINTFNSETNTPATRRKIVPNAAKALEQVLTCSRAREQWSRTRKLKNDPCTTRIGTLRRVSSINEVPQLINILREPGRPTPKVDSSYYLLVRPELTGLLPISGRNHAILFRTIPAVISSHGAF